MTKIISYIYTKGCFSRYAKETLEEDGKKKMHTIFSEPRVYAEAEIEEYLSGGWQILSSSTYTTGGNLMGSTIMQVENLVVILHKPEN